MAKNEKPRRSRRPFQLGLDPQVFNLQALREVSPEELKREYSRQRREGLDRLRGFARSAEFSKSQYYKEHKDLYNKRADQMSLAELRKSLIESKNFLMSERSSVSGQRNIRQRTIDTLHSQGYTFVNTKNFAEFWEFMDWYRGRYADKGNVGSPPTVAADVYGLAVSQAGADVASVKEFFAGWVAMIGGKV